MSMLPKTHLCTKCGKFHPVICEESPFGRAAKDAEITDLRAKLATVTAERDRLHQEIGGGDIYRHERDALREDLATITADLDAARAGAAIATERFVAAEATADRYREALERAATWFEERATQVGKLRGFDMNGVPGAYGIRSALNGYAEKCRRALADTSPPAQPAPDQLKAVLAVKCPSCRSEGECTTVWSGGWAFPAFCIERIRAALSSPGGAR